MARRRQRGLEALVSVIIRSQIGALLFGAIGVVLLSPIPKAIINSIAPSPITPGNLSGMVINGYTGGAMMMLPWVRILGAFMVLLAAGSLLFNGRKNAFLMAALTVATGFFMLMCGLATLILEDWHIAF